MAPGTVAPPTPPRVYRSSPRMAPIPPASVEELRTTGNQSFRNGQFAEAATLYSRALRMLQEQGATPAPRTPVSPPGLLPLLASQPSPLRPAQPAESLSALASPGWGPGGGGGSRPAPGPSRAQPSRTGFFVCGWRLPWPPGPGPRPPGPSCEMNL